MVWSCPCADWLRIPGFPAFLSPQSYGYECLRVVPEFVSKPGALSSPLASSVSSSVAMSSTKSGSSSSRSSPSVSENRKVVTCGLGSRSKVRGSFLLPGVDVSRIFYVCLGSVPHVSKLGFSSFVPPWCWLAFFSLFGAGSNLTPCASTWAFLYCGYVRYGRYATFGAICTVRTGSVTFSVSLSSSGATRAEYA